MEPSDWNSKLMKRLTQFNIGYFPTCIAFSFFFFRCMRRNHFLTHLVLLFLVFFLVRSRRCNRISMGLRGKATPLQALREDLARIYSLLLLHIAGSTPLNSTDHGHGGFFRQKKSRAEIHLEHAKHASGSIFTCHAFKGRNKRCSSLFACLLT